MEENSNVCRQKEAKAKVGKPPTRLQKQAPASLQLDKVAPAVDPSAVSSETPKAIPFLSPLELSPQPLPETVEKRSGPESGSGDQKDNGEEEKSDQVSSPGGWQHPAAPALADSPTLCTSFQSQCLLVDHVQ